jgi:hypothetical protein
LSCWLYRDSVPVPATGVVVVVNVVVVRLLGSMILSIGESYRTGACSQP